MSTKKDILAEIEKKAKRIREKRVDAINNSTLEAAIFEFFRNIEEARRMHNGEFYDKKLLMEAMRAMETRVKSFDNKAKTSVEWIPNENPESWDEGTIRGVTIWWSEAYIAKNNVSPSLYIDVSQMLLF